MIDLLDDLSKLTGIKQFNLKKLCVLAELDIANSIYELMHESNNMSIDLGIGILSIYLQDDDIIYNFEPSNNLKKLVNETVSNNESHLTKIIENKLDDKVLRTYKDIL